MADISKVTLPSGTTYDIKDATARSSIAGLQSAVAGGVTYIGTTTTALSDGATTESVKIDSKDVTPTAGAMVNYNNVMYVWNGSQWDQLGSAGALKALAYKDSASGSYTPAGSVSASFSGTEGSVSVTGTAAGTVSQPTFTGTSGTVSVSGTAAGSVGISAAAPASGETANYTPAGTNTGGAVTLNTTSVTPISGVGSLPTYTDNSFTVSGETLTLGAATFNPGALPTKGSAVTVATGVKSVTQPTFTGTAQVIKGTFTGTANTSTGTFKPAGSVSQPTFTGTANTSTGKFTPAGSVTNGKFTGTAATITVK